MRTLVVAMSLLCWSLPAHAEDDAELYRIQWLALTEVKTSGSGGAFTNQLNVSRRAFAASIGLGQWHHENDPSRRSDFVGFAIPLGAQLRPMFWLSQRLSRYVDPHIDVGVALGGSIEGLLLEASVGGGIDLAIPVRRNLPDIQAVLFLGYHRVATTLDGNDRLGVGLGLRVLPGAK